MIKKFFHGLNCSGISYLLISGQATVIYGAATFSEDIDLWVEPKIDNWNRLLKILNGIGATNYKLTPPVSMAFIQKGHGFHFQIPSNTEKLPYWFLDVMGIVPRTDDFRASYKNATFHKTDWGKIPIVSIRDLVDIKKTRRLLDYPIISNLVKIEYETLKSSKIAAKDWKWILENSFEAEDILFFLNNHDSAKKTGTTLKRKSVSLCLKALKKIKEKKKYFKAASEEIALEIESLRQCDRKYWEPIIKELKGLNKNNQFLPLGQKVSNSLSK